MDKRAITAEQTKKELKAAFIELYREKGLSGVTIGSVSKKAGYNRCTFYNHYDDIHAILEEIENELLATLESKAQNQTANLSFSGIESVFREFLAKFEEHGETIYALMGKNGDAFFRNRMLENAKRHFRENFKNQIDEDKVEYILTFLSSSALSLIEHWYETGKKYSTEEFLRMLQSLISTGIMGYLQGEMAAPNNTYK